MTIFHQHFFHCAVVLGFHLIHQLHGFHNADYLPLFYLISRFYQRLAPFLV